MNEFHDMPETTDRELRLTAYALGELAPQERRAVEALLEHDADARAEVEAIRATAGALATAFGGLEAPGLDAARRAVILSPARPAVIFSFVRLAAGLGLAAAACLAIAFAWPGGAGSSTLAPERDAVVHGGRPAPAADAQRDAAETRSSIGPERAETLAGRAGPGGGNGGLASGAAAPAASLEFASGTETYSLRMEPSDRGLAAAPIDASAARPDAPGVHVMFAGEALEKAGQGLLAPAASPAAPSPSGAPAAGVGGGFGGGGGGVGGRGRESPREAPVVHDWFGRDAELGVALDARLADADGADREAYARLVENGFVRPQDAPRSTFAVDVDTASYANVRRLLRDGVRPPAGAVRIEELVNAFRTADAPPTDGTPFAVHAAAADAPWAPAHRLVRIALKGREVPADMRPATSLVFLIDVSGSMNQPEKLPLVQHSLELLVQALLPDDKVAIAVYAGASGLVLPPTYAHDKPAILEAIRNLRAGGSTNGGAGIELAYRTAEAAFIEGGANRVILCTDGDFNVGTTSESALVSLIEEKRRSGVFLTVLGFGRGDWQDARMESLSNAGNGNFAYIDTIDEAKRALVEDLAGTLVTIAKDVKIQVEFNPAKVAAYRLLGYENRLMAAADFVDDAKDGGEIGAGHCVTAFYEVIPVGEPVPGPEPEPLAFGGGADDQAPSDDLAQVAVRWKAPDGETSTPLAVRIPDAAVPLADAGEDLRFGAAVAAFGMLLRGSAHAGDATWDLVRELARSSLGDDPHGRRAEFLELIDRAERITSPRPAAEGE